MARYVTKVRTDRAADEVFMYLADLTNFAEWDPGVSRSVQVTGDGPGANTAFDVTVASVGRPLTLRYETVTYDPPHELVVRAHSRVFTSIDSISVDTVDGSTVVTYDADLRLNGVLGLLDGGLKLVFGKIGDRAAAGLRRVLDGQDAT